MRPPIAPLPPRKSQYGIDPSLVKRRVSELPGITSLLVSELFPDLPAVILPGPGGVAAVRQAAEKALAGIDMGMIRPEHTVNVLASHHGFTLLGGEAYAEMLKTLKDVIERRTGCRNVRLRAGVGLRFRETEEYIRRHGLDRHFGGGKAIGVAPIDQGIPIETEIGTLYGIKKVYDADWIVHAHNSDVREVHFHRQVDRAVKPFGMSYARIETRSTYHQNLGPRAANFIARAIFDSSFVQRKFAFACFLAAFVGHARRPHLLVADHRPQNLRVRRDLVAPRVEQALGHLGYGDIAQQPVQRLDRTVQFVGGLSDLQADPIRVASWIHQE